MKFPVGIVNNPKKSPPRARNLRLPLLRLLFMTSPDSHICPRHLFGRLINPSRPGALYPQPCSPLGLGTGKLEASMPGGRAGGARARGEEALGCPVGARCFGGVGRRDRFGGAGVGEEGVYVQVALLLRLVARFAPCRSCLVRRRLCLWFPLRCWSPPFCRGRDQRAERQSDFAAAEQRAHSTAETRTMAATLCCFSSPWNRQSFASCFPFLGQALGTCPWAVSAPAWPQPWWQ